MKKKSILATSLVAVMASCASSSGPAFGHELNFNKGYNKNLWYKNDLEQHCADPSIIYCEEDGYYYMYMTSDDLGASGFYVYRSKMLNYWERLSPAFLPDPYSWGITNLWAPNAIKIQNKYYLYYSAYNHTLHRNGISVAVSDSPAGPFHEYEGLDANNRLITRNDQIFDFGYAAIDAAPFIDDNGDLYLYFAKDQVGGVSISCGVRLIDPVTADYDTVTELAYPGKSVYDGDTDIYWEKASGGYWNEAPFMLKIGSKYFLTYSANPFWNILYAVGYAVGDSPLGPFTKPNSYPNENLLLGVEPDESRLTNWDFMSGTGHHCFFYAGDELMIGYHAHTDRYYGNSIRAFALDKMFVEGDRLFANGPTWSLQPLPKSVSGYGNIASQATLTADTLNDENLLIDGKIPMHMLNSHHVDLQAKFAAGTHTITLEFPEEKKVAAVAIYNSLDYETCIKTVKSVDIKGYGKCENVAFNKEYMADYLDDDYEYIRPGCPFVVEINETKTKKITIVVSSDHEFALSDIVVLGRD